MMSAPPAPPVLDLPLRLELARRKAGLKQVEVAERIGLHRRTIANYEGGCTEPKLPTLEMWAEVCNVPAMWLAYGIDPGRDEAPRHEAGAQSIRR